ATSYKLQATSYKLQATSYKLQATSYKLRSVGLERLKSSPTSVWERSFDREPRLRENRLPGDQKSQSLTGPGKNDG
ncbi:MAG: hypothetical protein MI745_00005, partial [Pseudomonadales bacterium]|nr:hypothetical protein [Pseudomonadales bacterium]